MYEVLKAIATKLYSTATTSFFQQLGGRVYVNEAPANVALPLCVYGIAQHDITQTYDGDRERMMIEFTQYFPHQSGLSLAEANGERLHELLDNSELKPTGYDRVTIRAESRGVPAMEDDAIYITSRFRLMGTRTSGTASTTA
jgi:hypothetical protein